MKKLLLSKMYRSRIDDIINYRKHHTLLQTGTKFKLSPERVRQIVQEINRKRCSVHNRYYFNKCSYCMAKSYENMISFMRWKDFEKLIDVEAKNKSKTYLAVQRRVAIIKLLMSKKYRFNQSQIAIRLRRDRSTIIHLIEKYLK